MYKKEIYTLSELITCYSWMLLTPVFFNVFVYDSVYIVTRWENSVCPLVLVPQAI